MEFCLCFYTANPIGGWCGKEKLLSWPLLWTDCDASPIYDGKIVFDSACSKRIKYFLSMPLYFSWLSVPTYVLSYAIK